MDMAGMLREIDEDKDGKLSLQEHLAMDEDAVSEEDMENVASWKQIETVKFNAADRDKDGLLNEEELPALFYPDKHEDVLSAVMAETMRVKDKDKNGKLSHAEFRESSLEEDRHELSDFDILDKNKNGHIDLEELRIWESGHLDTVRTMVLLFKHADKDHDGQLTVDELTAAAEDLVGTEAHYQLADWAHFSDK